MAGALVGAGLAAGGGGPASADPAPAAGPTSWTTAGPISGVVPDGVCSARVTARGGAGGSGIEGVAETNGAGALITATYPVVPGQQVTGVVGAGGQPADSADGSPGVGGSGVGAGGSGGSVVDGDAGAGGGGSTVVAIAATVLIHAGGGGGSAGGDDTEGGFGGNAGIPSAFDTVTPGDTGLDGHDTATAPAGTAGGGAGGAVDGPGDGGAHSTDAVLNGFPGLDYDGGNGGDDLNSGSGGGGGGGEFGGGGGASTTAQSTGTAEARGNGGGGGGGGASLASSSAPAGLPGGASNLDASAGPRVDIDHDGIGADGAVSIEWIACEYDLGVTKVASHTAVVADTPMDWTITITNHGPDAMTRGDVVTLIDSLPGDATATEVIELSTPTGVTCDVSVGGRMTSPITCSRAFNESPFGGAGDGRSGLRVDESITIRYEQTFEDNETYVNVAQVTDRARPENNRATATLIVREGPVANPDATRDVIGITQSVDPLLNDVAWDDPPTPFDPTTLTLLDAAGRPVRSITTPGEGTFTIDTRVPATPRLVFTPVRDFVGTAEPVEYRITDEADNEAESTYTPTVIGAEPDTSNSPQGVPQTIDPLDNDTFAPDFPPNRASLTLLDTDGDETLVLVVPGEGTFTAQPDGTIRFVPRPDFVGTAAPAPYRVLDAEDMAVESTYTATVTPSAVPDHTSGRPGEPQIVDPLANDDPGGKRGLMPSTLRLVGPLTGEESSQLNLEGSGTYTVVAGSIHFQPEPDFLGEAPAITYLVDDAQHNTIGSTYTPTVTSTSASLQSAGDTTTTAAPNTTAPRTGSLPSTGSSGTRVLLLAALAAVITGSAMTMTRRPQRDER